MTSMSTTNAWLQRQRKSDLVEIAELVGLQNYEGQKKADLEVTLDEYLAENAEQFANESKLTPYYTSRAKAAAAASGSPVKKSQADGLKVSRRRTTRGDSETMNADSEQDESATSSALALRTPARNLSLASRIPLPATPAEVAEVVDRHTVAVRSRVNSMYQESGITERTHAVRDSLSTVTSIIMTISAIELFYLRYEVLPGRFAFSIPSVATLGNEPHDVYVPDLFQVLTSSFWSPVLTWLTTSVFVPYVFGYFYNLSAASQPTGRRTRSAQQQADYNVDPLTFSIMKAVISFLVYGQGVTFGGLINVESIQRINSAVFGGWKGILTGAAISSVVSVYDAVLRK